MVEAARAVLGLAQGEVFIKRRAPQRHRAGQQYERQAERGAWHEVGEGGRRFRVNLSDYLDTGLFLDHRITRARVAAEAAGKRVLNLYAYTGAFTVYVATAGADPHAPPRRGIPGSSRPAGRGSARLGAAHLGPAPRRPLRRPRSTCRGPTSTGPPTTWPSTASIRAATSWSRPTSARS